MSNIYNGKIVLYFDYPYKNSTPIINSLTNEFHYIDIENNSYLNLPISDLKVNWQGDMLAFKVTFYHRFPAKRFD